MSALPHPPHPGPRQRLLALLRAALPAGAYAGLQARYRAWRDRRALRRALRYDLGLFERGSGLLHPARPDALQAHILKSFHRIEKGLALRTPRPGFGADAVQALLEDLDRYLGLRGPDWVARAALDTLEAYLDFNAGAGTPRPELARRVAALRTRCAAGAPTGGTRLQQRAEVQAAAAVPFEAFVQARHSVRQFDPRPVDDAAIERAAALARHAPSVCNRSAGQVWSIDDPALARRLLAHQNGNRGFGDQAGRILVVTARQAAFHTVGERYQGWIDGGLFAMTLVYALHAQGLGTCCLNWSVEPETDRAFKREAGLPADDLVIMLVAVGHLPERYPVACSARRPLDEVLRHLPPRDTA